MAQWKLFRERRQRMWRALQLLVVSGVIRPANMELPSFESEESVAVPTSEATLR